MHVGLLLIFQNYEDQESDDQVYWNNLALGEQAEGLGYDSLWSVEHHFDGDYSMCPDNLQLLSYLAARTNTITLATGAVILPWNDPLRVAEKVSMLDLLCKGRFILGLGRGLSKLEYRGFRQDMNESRERFDEAAQMVLDTLETGIAEHEGKFYHQPRTPIRPRPSRTFKGRTYGVAMSPDSAESCARLGIGMMSFIQGPIDTFHLPIINVYRETYEKAHGMPAPPPLLSDLGYCHQDGEQAREISAKYCGQYFRTCVTHYEFAGEHFSATKGYEFYGQAAEMIKQAGLDAVHDAFVAAQVTGTPEEMVEQYRARKELIGDHGVLLVPYHGGIPYELVEESFKLMSKEVLPQLHKM